MSLTFDLEEELIAWKEEHGVQGKGRGGRPFQMIDWGQKQHLLVLLLTHLKEMGAEKDYFKSSNVRNQIGIACVGPKGAIGPASFTKGMNITYKELDVAINKVFETESAYFNRTGKIREFKKEPENNINLEEKIKKDADALAEAENKAAKTTTYNTTQNTPAPAQEKPISKEFDGSKYRTGPKNEWEIDPDFAILLGLDKKE